MLFRELPLQEFVEIRRCLATKDFHLKIDPFDDAITAQDGADGLASQLGMVVLFAQMAEPYVTQFLRSVLSQKGTTLMIAKMSTSATDTPFEIGRIRTARKHLLVVVALQDKVVGGMYHLLKSRSNLSGICDEAERDVLSLDTVAHTVATVMKHLKGSHGEVAQHDGHHLMQRACMALGEFACHTIVAVDAQKNLRGGIDRDIEIVGQITYGLNMVGMVVRDEHAIQHVHAEAIGFQHPAQGPHIQSRIYENACAPCRQEIAVTTAPTSQAKEFNHNSTQICTKVVYILYLSKEKQNFLWQITKMASQQRNED